MKSYRSLTRTLKLALALALVLVLAACTPGWDTNSSEPIVSSEPDVSEQSISDVVSVSEVSDEASSQLSDVDMAYLKQKMTERFTGYDAFFETVDKYRINTASELVLQLEGDQKDSSQTQDSQTDSHQTADRYALQYSETQTFDGTNYLDTTKWVIPKKMKGIPGIDQAVFQALQQEANSKDKTTIQLDTRAYFVPPTETEEAYLLIRYEAKDGKPVIDQYQREPSALKKAAWPKKVTPFAGDFAPIVHPPIPDGTYVEIAWEAYRAQYDYQTLQEKFPELIPHVEQALVKMGLELVKLNGPVGVELRFHFGDDTPNAIALDLTQALEQSLTGENYYDIQTADIERFSVTVEFDGINDKVKAIDLPKLEEPPADSQTGEPPKGENTSKAAAEKKYEEETGHNPDVQKAMREDLVRPLQNVFATEAVSEILTNSLTLQNYGEPDEPDLSFFLRIESTYDGKNLKQIDNYEIPRGFVMATPWAERHDMGEGASHENITLTRELYRFFDPNGETTDYISRDNGESHYEEYNAEYWDGYVVSLQIPSDFSGFAADEMYLVPPSEIEEYDYPIYRVQGSFSYDALGRHFPLVQYYVDFALKQIDFLPETPKGNVLVSFDISAETGILDAIDVDLSEVTYNAIVDFLSPHVPKDFRVQDHHFRLFALEPGDNVEQVQLPESWK